MDINTDEVQSLNPPSRYSQYHRSFSLEIAVNPSETTMQRLAKSTVLWVAFGLAGWYYPRYLIANETAIATKAAPYQPTAAGDAILDFRLNEPLVHPPTIPSALLVYASIVFPLLLVVVHAWISSISKPSSKWHEITTAVSGFSMATGLCEGTTQLLKLAIQRRRPNFYALCGFSMETLQCTADLDHVREANFSFPSGHSSLSCCAMTFLVWYFLGKNHTHGRFASLAICVVFWGWSLLVGASRLVDRWHHYDDVVAGLGLGFAVGTIVYHTWYPPVWSKYEAGMPRSLLEELETLNNNKLPSFSD